LILSLNLSSLPPLGRAGGGEGVAAGVGSITFGVLLLLAFAIGRALPILLGGWAVGALETMKPLSRYQRSFEAVGGVVLVLTGLYMLNAFFLFIPELAV
jgi:cytochrome c-type biogenesis protein